MGILGHIYPNGKRKNFAFGCVGANGPIGAYIGAIMSAVISQLWWWPWNFWILSIVSAVLAVASWVFIPNVNIRDTVDLFNKLDPWGCLTGVSGLILLNFVWNQGPIQGWNTVYVIVLLIIAVLFIIAFFVLELYVS
ncbi:Low affinity ammonium transporter, partial [Candida tropicalis]